MSAADKPDVTPATLTVTVAGGTDGLQGVVLVDPETGAHYRPGCTIAVSTCLAREWQKQGWVTIADDEADTESTPPATPARRKRPAAAKAKAD